MDTFVQEARGPTICIPPSERKPRPEAGGNELSERRCSFTSGASSSKPRPTPVPSAQTCQWKDPRLSPYQTTGCLAPHRCPVPLSWSPHFRVHLTTPGPWPGLLKDDPCQQPVLGLGSARAFHGLHHESEPCSVPESLPDRTGKKEETQQVSLCPARLQLCRAERGRRETTEGRVVLQVGPRCCGRAGGHARTSHRTRARTLPHRSHRRSAQSRAGTCAPQADAQCTRALRTRLVFCGRTRGSMAAGRSQDAAAKRAGLPGDATNAPLGTERDTVRADGGRPAGGCGYRLQPASMKSRRDRALRKGEDGASAGPGQHPSGASSCSRVEAPLNFWSHF